MRVWPVLLVWDTTLPAEYRDSFREWWRTELHLLTAEFGLNIAVRIIQLTPGSSVQILGVSGDGSDFELGSSNLRQSVLETSSSEFQSLEDAVVAQRPWLGVNDAVAPTLIRVSSRQIDRPAGWGELLKDVTRRVPNILFFEYQARSGPNGNKQWLTEKNVRKLKLESFHKQNFAPESEGIFPTFLSNTKLNIKKVLELSRKSGAPGVNVRSTTTATTTAPKVASPLPNPVAPPPSTEWSPSTHGSAQSNPTIEERPTREFRPSRSPAVEVPENSESLLRDMTVTNLEIPSSGPIDQPKIHVVEATTVVADEPPQSAENEEQIPSTVEKRKDWKKRLPWNRHEDTVGIQEVDAPTLGRPPQDIDVVASGDEHEPDLPMSGTESERLRTKNGQLVVDTPSTINAKPWFTPKWFKVPVVGPSRDVELEYGGVNSLRLMAASVRGTRHQFYGEPNQDAFAIGQNENFLIVVVCDGVGSAVHSAYGSKYISFSVARSLANSLELVTPGDLPAIRDCITAAVQKASDGVQDWKDGALFAPDAPAHDVDRHDLSATLVVGVVEIQPSAPEGRVVLVANVGDSPCYTFVDSEWTLRTEATKDGDVLEHATSALPTEFGSPVVLEWHDFVMNPREQLLLMTDGIGTSLASGRTPLGEWLGERLSSPVLARNYLETVDAISFDRQGEDDDRTLVVLYDFDHAFTEPPAPPQPDVVQVVDTEDGGLEQVTVESPGVEVFEVLSGPEDESRHSREA